MQHDGRYKGPPGKRGGFKGGKKGPKEEKKPMDKDELHDQLDKELAQHNAKIGGNTEIYAKMQQDKLNEELTKFREGE